MRAIKVGSIVQTPCRGSGKVLRTDLTVPYIGSNLVEVQSSYGEVLYYMPEELALIK